MNKSILLAGLVLCLCAPAAAAGIADGWGGYTFGMSPEQARAVPGRSWGALKGSGPLGLMEANAPVTQNGVAYDLSLWFRPAGALDQIFLSSSIKTTTVEACRQIFLAALKHGDSDYGAFAPLRDAKPQSEENGVTSSVELHDVAGASSRYQELHMIEKEIPFHAFDARRVEDGHSFAISSDWTVTKKGQTRGECFTKLIYDKSA